MNCPRCSAHVVDAVIHVEDGPDGLYVVTEEPVADYLHACRCGADIAVSSSRPTAIHPGQIRLVVPEHPYDTDYHGGTAHMSGAGDVLTHAPAPWSARSHLKEGQRASQ